ncbi:MAG: GTPase Era [Bifidobacteriaceae bacterium]|jgi:GTP-binding protein Era|nr:GTPase Era [Bifidobacteriaceae bacterium]MCI1978617.1 GTPase Era [Bifidobacteriaceae bacterium]
MTTEHENRATQETETSAPQKTPTQYVTSTPQDSEAEVSTGQAPTDEQHYRSGFVAVVGRPNVGKSTLINALVGKQVAITSSRPETTRKAIRAILTRPTAQIVLVDTPGIHRPRTLLGQRLNDVVDDSLSDVDAVAFLLPANQEIGPGDRRILERLRADFGRKKGQASAQPQKPDFQDRDSQEQDSQDPWKIPVIAIVTKIDELERPQLIDKLIEIDQFGHFSQIIPVSALTKDNLDEVEKTLIGSVPEGPQMYPEETVSEESPRDTIAELVRGAFLEELNDELPHSLAVVVDELDYPDSDEADSTEPVRALVSLYVERDSQKPIIIGHHAEHLVRVKKKVRTAVNRAVGRRTRLELHVKVSKEWQSDPKKLDRLGF